MREAADQMLSQHGHNTISRTSAQSVCIPTLQSAKLPQNLKPQDKYFGFDFWPESNIGTVKAPRDVFLLWFPWLGT